MSKTIRLMHYYNTAPQKLWALAIDFAALAKVNEGRISFAGLPQGQCETGQSLDIKVKLFGKMPAEAYHIDILECDHTQMLMRSSEQTNGIKKWNHTMQVIAVGDGACLSDEIEIDAGFMTPIIALWAKYMYGARHKPRLSLLGLDAANA